MDRAATAEGHAVSVQEAFASVMADVQSVRKTGQNTQQNYSFRGIDAVMNAVGPALRNHGVVIIPTLEDATYRDIEVGKNRTLMREITVRVRYTIHGPDGDTMEGVAPGESMDSGDKGTAKAMSVAYRTFLLQALTIPTDEPDPDEHSYERAPAQPDEVACRSCSETIQGARSDKEPMRVHMVETHDWLRQTDGTVKPPPASPTDGSEASQPPGAPDPSAPPLSDDALGLAARAAKKAVKYEEADA